MNEQESVSENQELESDKERGREGVGSDEVELAPNYLKNSLLWDTMLQGRSGKTFSYNCGTRRKEEDLPSIQIRKSGLYKDIDQGGAGIRIPDQGRLGSPAIGRLKNFWNLS